jgi:outer membrane receptor protein involved in Fe transport
VQIHIARTTLSRALGLALLGMASGSAFAQAQEQPQPQEQPPTAGQPPSQEQAQVPTRADANDPVTELDRVVVTGYRQSIQFATDAKRESTNFTDSIFAEDIGKFPDLNIAESLNRIPGIQLSREVNGEGVNISIRGLGTSFTKTLLNGSQIAVASTGGTDSQNQNREVDLDLWRRCACPTPGQTT